MVSLAELEEELLDEPSARATGASSSKLGSAQDAKQASKSDVDEEDTFMIRKSRVRCAGPAAAQGGRSFGSTANAPPSSSGHGHAASGKKARKNQGPGRKFNKGGQDAGGRLGSAAFAGATASKGASLQQQTIASFCLPRGSSQIISKRTTSTEATCPPDSVEPEETQLRVRLCDPPYGASASDDEQHSAQRSAHGLMAESGESGLFLSLNSQTAAGIDRRGETEEG